MSSPAADYLRIVADYTHLTEADKAERPMTALAVDILTLDTDQLRERWGPFLDFHSRRLTDRVGEYALAARPNR